ncbi:tRNA (guanine(9)-N(1))-methyltransferase [Nowakowskiella sp. JEL0407]|nr:tRNA (guanine(9)-N(1))-methyltransferase [Nowakowskiella sp. JEL0407]
MDLANEHESNQPDTASETGSVNETQPGSQSDDTAKSKSELRKQKKIEKQLLRKQFQKLNRKEEKRRRKESKRKRIEEGLPSLQKRKPDVQVKSDVRIVIDLNFEDKMSEKELNSTCMQFARCYSVNKLALHPVSLIATSFTKKFEEILSRMHPHYEKWCQPLGTSQTETQSLESDLITANNSKRKRSGGNVEFFEQHFSEVYANEKNNLVYLTADSKNVLQNLDESKIYIIGGLVDRNRYKNLCRDEAEKLSIQTASLPILEYVEMKSRTVLTINHVFEIMSLYLEIENWEEVLMRILPKRKEWRMKQQSEIVHALDEQHSEGDDDDDDDDGEQEVEDDRTEKSQEIISKKMKHDN